MSRLAGDGTAKTVRETKFEARRGTWKFLFPCSADDWQPYPVHPCVLKHTHIHTCIVCEKQIVKDGKGG